MVEKKGVKKESKNVRNIISIILGSVSILLSFFFPYLVSITGILGIIFAYAEKGKGYKKANIWAFTLNLIGLFLAIIILTLSFLALIYLSSSELNSLGIYQ